MTPHEELILKAFSKQLRGPVAAAVSGDRDSAHAPGQISKSLNRLLAQSKLAEWQASQSRSLAKTVLSRIDATNCASDQWEPLINKLSDLIEEDEGDTTEIDRVLVQLSKTLAANGKSDHEVFDLLVSADAERIHGLEEAYDRLCADEAAASEAASTHGLTREQADSLVEQLVTQCGESKDLKFGRTSVAVGGYSKLTIIAKLENASVLPADMVIRLDRAESPVGSTIALEYPLLTALRAHGLKVPRPLFADLDGEITGGPMMITTREPGGIVADPHQFDIPIPAPTLGRSLAQELARIHSVPLDELPHSLRGLGQSNRDIAAADLDHLRETWDAAGGCSITVEAAFRWLRDHLDAIGERKTLVHGDCRFNNILVEGEDISAVLDWELASVGNPAFDLGYTYHHASQLMPWQDFLQAYSASGGAAVSENETRYYALRTELFAVAYLAKLQAGIKAGAFENIDLIYAGTHVLQHNLHLLAMRLAAVINGEPL